MGLHHANVGGVLFNTQLDNDRKKVEDFAGMCFCGKLNNECDEKSHKRGWY